jgi:hypothetical protein
MRKFAVSVLLFSQIIWAQAPISPRAPGPVADPAVDRRIQQEAFEKWAIDGDHTEKAAIAAQQSQAAQEFYVKAKQFVQLWQAFAAELNDKKTFNAKLAKQVAKAFHDLEKSDGWSVGRQK